MDLVIDTSVIIAVVANEPHKPELVKQTTGASLYAPASVHWEVGNAFSAMLKRKRITLGEAEQAIAVYHGVPIRFLDVELTDALRLADRLGIYAYDAYIIAAAQQQKCSLLALDHGLARAARQAGVTVLELKS